MKNKTPLRVALALSAFLFAGCRTDESARSPGFSEVAPHDSDSAIAMLKAGAAGLPESHISNELEASRLATVETQKPYAVVVGCSDSRTSPDLIFKTVHGELFVVRTAGNVVDDFALGSIEYAVANLESKVIVVLAHDHCGAVKAALSGGHFDGHVADIVQEISPSVAASKGLPGDALCNAVEANARRVAAQIRTAEPLSEMLARKRIKVVPAVYNKATGKIRWL